MPLNIGATGSIRPYVKFNAKADKWFARGDAGDVEIGRPTFIADLANVVTGWFHFVEGQAPQRVIDPSLDFFGGLAELSSASIHMGNAIQEVYATFEAERGSHPGQVPVVACTGSEPMKDRYGTNYRPKLQIVKWVDRPAELPDESPVEASEVSQGAPAPTSGPQPVQTPPRPAAPTSPESLMEAEF